MAAQQIAQLGAAAAAAAAAAPACFDAAQAGGTLWVAARAGERCVHVLRSPLGSSGARARAGSLHAVLQLPEAVAAVQLGVPTEAATAAPPGTAVLVAVGSSCRVWAFQLQPRSTAAGAEPAEVTAEDAAVAAVPVAQQHCPARHQLAAAVAWEHLAFAWDPAAAVAPAPAAPGVAPLALCKLQAALQQQYGGEVQQEGQQAPHLVHTVASWACRSGPAEGIPADATAVSYLGLAAVAGGSSDARLVSSSRHELAAAAATAGSTCSRGGNSWPAGCLLVASAAGGLQALPVGTPCGGSSHQQEQPPAAAPGLPAVVCCTGSSICVVPASSSAGGAQPPQQLALLATSGRLVSAAAAGLGSSRPVIIVPGGSSTASSAAHASAQQPPLCTLLLVGVQATAAAGGRLAYLPCAGSTPGSHLHSLDASGGLAAGTTAASLPLAGAPQAALLAAAVQQAGGPAAQQNQRLVLLSDQGAVLALPAPQGGSLRADGSSSSLSVRRLESRIQVGVMVVRSAMLLPLEACPLEPAPSGAILLHGCCDSLPIGPATPGPCRACWAALQSCRRSRRGWRASCCAWTAA